MAEEAQAQIADGTQDPQGVIHSSQDMEGVEKIENADPSLVEFAPLFEDEMGEAGEPDTSTDDEGKDPEDPKDTPATDQPKDGDEPESDADGKKKDGAAEPDGDAKPKDGADKPPAGMVPIAALHEERAKRQNLTAEVQSLRSQLAARKAGLPENGEESSVPEDFKVLSDSEFSELAEDDPTAAVIYQRHLQRHIENKTAKETQERYEKDTIDRTLDAMGKIVPGLFDEASDANQTLTDFAVSSGLDDVNVLGAITNPRTRFIDADGNPQLLGEGAAKVVALLASAHRRSQGADEAAMRKQIEKEVTETIMKKFKTTGNADESHASIGDIPGSSGEDIDMRDYSESELMKLSAAERRRWLGG